MKQFCMAQLNDYIAPNTVDVILFGHALDTCSWPQNAHTSVKLEMQSLLIFQDCAMLG